MDAQVRPKHDPVGSAKREMLLFRKINPTKRGGWVGSESTDFDFLLSNLCQSVLFLLYNPRPPMRGLASLKGNTLPVKNVINGLDTSEYLYANDFA